MDISIILKIINMFILVLSMCNSNDFNRQQCMKEWDVWLVPELKKGWDIYSGKEVPYQNEKEILEDINN